MNEILNADSQQIFLDWSTPAVLQQRVQTFDPVNGSLELLAESVTVHVIPGPDIVRRDQGTVGLKKSTSRSFLVRNEELPEDWNLLTAEITIQEKDYRIASVDSSFVTGTVVLQCESRTA
ncbi:hypothetical protein KOR42_46100 [Thalassoglobus neptunius]|uniref:Uncharacterized protein n=1 Tax=Thalassoglobus neptunius TaxID=1938619 RepID=A0A5C5VVV1_9PLAN|nr:hypothetical protein [Thalassoglobus neptunius]TWT42806.1 hypothetical protein KOR42_46100 [Thalassoglobus neptunius]